MEDMVIAEADSTVVEAFTQAEVIFRQVLDIQEAEAITADIAEVEEIIHSVA